MHVCGVTAGGCSQTCWFPFVDPKPLDNRLRGSVSTGTRWANAGEGGASAPVDSPQMRQRWLDSVLQESRSIRHRKSAMMSPLLCVSQSFGYIALASQNRKIRMFLKISKCFLRVLERQDHDMRQVMMFGQEKQRKMVCVSVKQVLIHASLAIWV